MRFRMRDASKAALAPKFFLSVVEYDFVDSYDFPLLKVRSSEYSEKVTSFLG